MTDLLPNDRIASLLGHPFEKRRKTDPQLALAVTLGHLGWRPSHTVRQTAPSSGTLTEGIKEAERQRAKQAGFFALARHYLAPQSAPLPSRRVWRLPRAWQLDQGDTPQCVAYTKAHWHRSLPVALVHPVPAADYARAKQLDGWPSEDGTDAGTMLRVAQEQGVVDSTWWWSGPADTEALDRWLLTIGPVWWGAPWCESMFRTTKVGRIEVTDELKYGHETLLIGSDRKRKTRIVCNSWGIDNWGVAGRGELADADFDKIMAAGGDAVGIIEKRAA